MMIQISPAKNEQCPLLTKSRQAEVGSEGCQRAVIGLRFAVSGVAAHIPEASIIIMQYLSNLELTFSSVISISLSTSKRPPQDTAPLFSDGNGGGEQWSRGYGNAVHARRERNYKTLRDCRVTREGSFMWNICFRVHLFMAQFASSGGATTATASEHSASGRVSRFKFQSVKLRLSVSGLAPLVLQSLVQLPMSPHR